jgi:hypothetical protein
MNESDFDLKLLSLGWSDWILIGEIEQRFREAGSDNSWEEAIAWVGRFVNSGYLSAGTYSDGRFQRWPNIGTELEARIRDWLVIDPRDPLGPSMTLMLELTDAGKDIIPPKERY